MFVVQNKNQVFFLRATIWTSDLSRATFYQTAEEAVSAIKKVATCNKRDVKGAVVLELHDLGTFQANTPAKSGASTC